MKETKQKFLDKLEENQLAQEINSIEEINNNNNPVITSSTTIETTTIPEEHIGEYLLNKEESIPTPNPIEEPVIERPKNTVRYIDSGFTF